MFGLNKKYTYFFSYAVWKPQGIAFGNSFVDLNFKIKDHGDMQIAEKFLRVKRNVPELVVLIPFNVILES